MEYQLTEKGIEICNKLKAVSEEQFMGFGGAQIYLLAIGANPKQNHDIPMQLIEFYKTAGLIE